VTDGLRLRHTCDRELLPARLAERFVELAPDAETERYLARAAGARAGRLRTALQSMLCYALSDFDANALLGMYPMHLLGRSQWTKLLGDGARGRLLDVGAGSGDVTAQLAPLFSDVLAIEPSRAMAWRLRRRGFRCSRIDVAEHPVPGAPYEVISCLNVLDRCARPQTLLAKLVSSLGPNGRLVVALALPYSPFVYDGPLTLDPIERLPCDQPIWEHAVTALVERVLEPLSLRVVSLARAPYLSGGDARLAIYELDDVIVVCEVAS
jgi:SAM-dependent methyltransferase